jgi:hypothetical protein
VEDLKMFDSWKCMRLGLFAMWALLIIVASSFGQSGVGGVRGQVTDPSGATVPAIAVIAVGPNGAAQQVQTNEEGRYVFRNLPPGTYTLRIQVKGFADFTKAGVVVMAGQVQVVDAQLVVALEKQQVTITDSAAQVSVSSENNASALVLKGKDLESLSDDPDELQSQLQALAGPAAGPNGGEIYIDGFTGGQLPLKSAIREIRVNQNPFSAQYDKLGYGRIEILTKPGQDKFHGQGFAIFNSSALNSRNPFVSQEPSYHHELFDGSLGGPLSSKASFFFDGGHRNIGTNSIVSAMVLDSNLQQTPFSQAVPGPHTSSNLSSRVDYQLSSKNTLTVRYQFWQDNNDNSGIGQFALASQGYNIGHSEHTLQISDSQVISERAVNDLRFEFVHDSNSQIPLSLDPTIQVIGAFTGGGSSQGKVLDTQDHHEVHDLASISLGKHYLTFGGRLRDVNVWDSSSGNFNGYFTFPSLDSYQSAELSLLACKTAGQTGCQVGGASQFTITSGNPTASVNWIDAGLYTEDQWRLRPNMSLSLGLRYETQNSIHDRADVAPRLGFAWGVGHGRTAKTVVRAGFGIFYDRFEEAQVMQADRLNGKNQEQYVVTDPDFYPLIPALSQLQQLAVNQLAPTVYQIDPRLRAPYTIQSAVGLERQLSKNATVSVTYLNSHGVHQLMTRNINAPLPGTYVFCSTGDTSCTSLAGVRPYGEVGNIYQFESDGLFNQNQLVSNFNVRMGTKLSLFGFYSLSFADSNTAGVNTFPSDQYDIALDYGRAAFDVRHRLFLGGSFSLFRGFRLSPFMMTSSGAPFNITVGQDLNGDSIFNDRPAFAPAGATGSNIIATKWGNLDTAPKAGETIIPINYGTGPGFFELNLRLSKTFGFGRRAERSTSAGGMQGPPPGGGRGGPPPGGGGLGPGGLSGGGGGPGGPFGSAATNTRYSLTFSVGARNVFNLVNLGTPIGQLTSPLFGKSNSLAGFFANGGNRHVDFQVVFSF